VDDLQLYVEYVAASIAKDYLGYVEGEMASSAEDSQDFMVLAYMGVALLAYIAFTVVF
jgi:hypothetical protein